MQAVAVKLSAAGFTAKFTAYVNAAIRRWQPFIEVRLNAEGRRASRAYLAGGEAAATAEVDDWTYRVILDRIWLSTVPGAGGLVADMLGKAAQDVFVQAALRWLRDNAGLKIAGMSDTSRREIGNQIRIGVSKGENQLQIARRIYKTRKSVSPERALLIAQTEIHAAANYGSLIAAQEEKSPMLKVWHAMAGARPTHAAASGQKVALNESFSVGAAKLPYPGAPGPPEETINCRCSLQYEAIAAERPRRRRPAA